MGRNTSVRKGAQLYYKVLTRLCLNIRLGEFRGTRIAHAIYALRIWFMTIGVESFNAS